MNGSLYKFLLAGGRSANGNATWKVGDWLTIAGPLRLCERGFHACPKPLDALRYVGGEILCEVEGRDEQLQDTDKECWRSMRVIRAWQWPSRESVALAVFSAELAYPNWEAKYPSDGRVRAAIEAARIVAVGGVLDESAAASAAASARSAARSAQSAAESAAWSAAESAAWSARSAAESAWSAQSAAWSAESAWSAAWSAGSARSAGSAAWSAWSAALSKINDYMIERIPHLAVAELR